MINQFIETNSKIGIFGAVDEINHNGASGWLIDASDTQQPHDIKAFLNDQLIGSTTTSILRTDISATLGKDIYCGFYLKWDKNSLEKVINDTEAQNDLALKFMLDGCLHTITILPSVTNHGVRAWLAPPKIFGSLDCIDDRLTAHGWAINTKDNGRTNVSLEVNGRHVTTREAKLPRPDLGVLKPAQILSGFKIPIPPDAVDSFILKVDAFVDGHKLPGSTQTVDLTAACRVSEILVSNGCITASLIGWPGEKISGQLFVNGQPQAELSFMRAGNLGAEQVSCSWRIPESFADGRARVYTITLGAPENPVRSDAKNICYPEYLAHVDEANQSFIEGWAFSNDFRAPIKLELYKGDALICTQVADQPRHDVRSALMTNHLRCGFKFRLTEHEAAEFAEYTVRDANTQITLLKVNVATPYETLTRFVSEMALESSQLASIALKTLITKAVTTQTQNNVFSTQFMPLSQTPVDEDPIEVIIPIYGGAGETIECVESVIAAQNKMASRIILINDCSPDPLIKSYLSALDARKIQNLIIIHRTKNGGFSEAVNLGFNIAEHRNVILLNADTIVQDRWLDRICAAAKQDKRIGTITPLSNNAEICTVPYICKSLNVEDRDFAKKVDYRASQINCGLMSDIPVAIGFCMFIRRQCLNDVGPFDAAKWGKGYGEEVDFCLKASANGWRHKMLSDTFVVHRGNVSFGDEKLERVKESARKISETYPFYDGLIQRYLSRDPGKTHRRRLNIGIIGDLIPINRVLHITHNYGGGTQRYVTDMEALNRAEDLFSVRLQFESDGTCKLFFNMSEHQQGGFFMPYHEESYNAAESDILIEDLAKLNIGIVHLHSPYGIQPAVLNWISDQTRLIITVHDYSWICPQVTHNPSSHTFKGGNYHDCNLCVKLHEPHIGLRHFVHSDTDIDSYRDTFVKLFKNADNVLVGAVDVRDRMLRSGMNASYKVVPHAAPASSIFNEIQLLPTSDNSGPIRVAMIGGISDIKGYFTLQECAREAERRKLPIEFLVFGHTMDDLSLGEFRTVTILGRYEESDLYDLMCAQRPDIVFFPNKSPETFSYTLSHSLRMGLWPVASDIGAPAERIRAAKFGTVYCDEMPIHGLVNLLIDEGLKSRKNHHPKSPENHITYPASYSEYIAKLDESDLATL